MTVQELIEQLQALGQPDLEVFIAKDAEGNGFRKLDDVQIDPMVDGEAIHPEDAEMYAEEGEDITYAVVFWP